ncbi:hypothetical protein Sru01_23200 [Sphaerisporangium rufum]|uniref:Class I SAM-dependent methyltransferase n=1 Tax=Sphaerisporangium rufum TaxID=1381558 RepID=A0A919V107_9ACTN|nr:class I SAM-dependent methyltransferase [Sphaerisporangium rufum]GII77338.1 hypothetical protein Sru01_23200 [Sphaerisporangium rufum]
MAGEKVEFTREKETLLATLYGRAAHSRAGGTVLRDPLAERAVERIDYDFHRLRMRPVDALAVAIRARAFDVLTAERLAALPGATVVHLACGLDTRVHRLDPPPGVRWFDVDYPDVIELRRRLFPPRAGYTMIGLPATDPGWAALVPGDRPLLAVAEGLMMYLTAAQVREVLGVIAGRSGSGEFVFDAISRAAVKLSRLQPQIRVTGATMRWGLTDPAEITAADPRFRLVRQIFYSELPDVARFPAGYRAALAVVNRVYFLRRVGRILDYRF